MCKRIQQPKWTWVDWTMVPSTAMGNLSTIHGPWPKKQKSPSLSFQHPQIPDSIQWSLMIPTKYHTFFRLKDILLEFFKTLRGRIHYRCLPLE